MNDTEDRLRRLLAEAPPELGGLDPETLLASRTTQGHPTRTRLVTIAASVAAVACVAVTVSMLASSGTGNRQPAGQSVTDHAPAGTFADIPESVFEAAGAPQHFADAVSRLAGPALTQDSKPEVLHIGADWAPYDAAERWALAAALSRFGTLTGLAHTASKAADVDPNTATISFASASYTSDYVSVVFKDIQGRDMKSLDKLTAAEEHIFSEGGESFPFIDIAGRYKIATQFDPAVLKGLDQAQIADALTDPTSPVAKAVLGAANVLTAAICEATGGQPMIVCSSAAVLAAERLLDTIPDQPAKTNGTN
jgi:hypothetical protein